MSNEDASSAPPAAAAAPQSDAAAGNSSKPNHAQQQHQRKNGKTDTGRNEWNLRYKSLTSWKGWMNKRKKPRQQSSEEDEEEEQAQEDTEILTQDDNSRQQKGGSKRERNDGAKGAGYDNRKRIKMDKDGNEIVKENPFSKEEIEAESRRPKKKVAVMIGYSGTGYRGMQVNGDDKTIERDLFRAFVEAGAISKANADDPKKSGLVRCARTDKGVHAAGNVISLKLIIEDEDIMEKINKALPEQIRIWGIQRTMNSFSCYQMCDSRWYEYLMPSYSLLPPHPETYMGKNIDEMAKKYGKEEELAGRQEDVKDFWKEVEERDVKPILEALDEDVRREVEERMHKGEETVGTQQPDNPKGIKELDGGEDIKEGEKKKRTPTAVDFALRDIKLAYINAKRAYRVSPSRLQRLQSALTAYEGSHLFHNYTVQKSSSDPSARRHIKSFLVNPEPVVINNTEWLSLKVHGQSFMMHQIRKMVGLATLLTRCGGDINLVQESYGKKVKMAIPKAPGLGLLLERPVFEMYNRKADGHDKRPIDFGNYEAEMREFKDKHIYQRIFEIEEAENSFYSFFNQIDQFKMNHFLWVTAGGLEVAQLDANAGAAEKKLDATMGEEEENPEGGEG